ncbi:permease [Candidatus Clostridium radicumherbarum]|uniref:Permease n=1 Tax=Candidatus Clostridium radicumherbarum TaxID=3381662 RepID=A0ABW8TVC6_9CLOT
MNAEILQNFSVIFISIILEALPFVMLGVIISALIQVFISENTIARLLPKNKFLGILMASLSGFVFPICECAVIPIGRRLIKKGVPVNMAVAFMLSVPIVNPIVLLSTYYAFHGRPYVVLIRGLVGFIIALTIGTIMGAVENLNCLKPSYSDYENICSCGYNHSYKKKASRFMEVLNHVNTELYDIGKFLIIGAFISAAFQAVVPRNQILSLGQNSTYSIIVMLLFAFLVSLCSEADAFIASTFIGQFTLGSIIGFLLLGPMIDIKNTLMLNYSFKKGFIAKQLILIFAFCFAAAYIINVFFKL